MSPTLPPGRKEETDASNKTLQPGKKVRRPLQTDISKFNVNIITTNHTQHQKPPSSEKSKKRPSKPLNGQHHPVKPQPKNHIKQKPLKVQKKPIESHHPQKTIKQKTPKVQNHIESHHPQKTIKQKSPKG
ncbi:3657_t:CDS:2 [Entrophospora sp. SA101]|nr:3657_t:CDS:2 [Entrophospora sp. SA101]